MNTYTTSEVAKIIGIHPNTVRMYEGWGLIPLAERKLNGYRVFTDYHIEQLRLARIAFQIEVLQNGLRKKVIEIIKFFAKGDFDKALMFAEEYLSQIQREQRNAEESIDIAKQSNGVTVCRSGWSCRRYSYKARKYLCRCLYRYFLIWKLKKRSN